MLGSTSHTVLHHAHCLVAVVRGDRWPGFGHPLDARDHPRQRRRHAQGHARLPAV